MLEIRANVFYAIGDIFSCEIKRKSPDFSINKFITLINKSSRSSNHLCGSTYLIPLSRSGSQQILLGEFALSNPVKQLCI